MFLFISGQIQLSKFNLINLKYSRACEISLSFAIRGNVVVYESCVDESIQQ